MEGVGLSEGPRSCRTQTCPTRACTNGRYSRRAAAPRAVLIRSGCVSFDFWDLCSGADKHRSASCPQKGRNWSHFDVHR